MPLSDVVSAYLPWAKLTVLTQLSNILLIPIRYQWREILEAQAKHGDNLEPSHESEARYDAGDLRRNDALASSILSSYPWGSS